MNARYLLPLAAVVVGFGWPTRPTPGSSERPEMAATETRPSLTAFLSPGRKPGTVVVEYRNYTATAVRVNAQVFGNSILALEVLDAKDQVIPTVTPSVPWLVTRWVVIQAGGVERMEYEYIRGFSPRLPPGRYQVRLGISGWEAELLAVTVE